MKKEFKMMYRALRMGKECSDPRVNLVFNSICNNEEMEERETVEETCKHYLYRLLVRKEIDACTFNLRLKEAGIKKWVP